jgi:queuosine precursor transporter
MINSHNSSIQFKYFFIILTLFSATWLISNIAAVKLISVFGLTLTGGFFIFPFTTMLSGLIVEVYGYKNARQAIWCGFILNLLFVFFINLVNSIPPSPHWKLEEQFENILVPETRIIMASIFSFLLSDFANSYIMAKMKMKNHGKSLFKRIIASNFCAISMDIFSFMLIAFCGAISAHLLLKLTLAAYIKKFIFQILLLPAQWLSINHLKKLEGVEIYDYETKFNPFSIENDYNINSFNKERSSNNIINYQPKALKNSI